MNRLNRYAMDYLALYLFKLVLEFLAGSRVVYHDGSIVIISYWR